MGDAALLRAGEPGGQDYVSLICAVVFRGEKYERPRRAPRCVLLEAVLAGAAPGVAAARPTDRRRDGGPPGFVELVLDAPDPQDGEEDALSPTEEG